MLTVFNDSENAKKKKNKNKKIKSTAHLSVHSNKNKRWDRGIRFCIINYSTPFISSFFLLKFVTFICLARYTLQRVVKKILYICTESWAVWISAFPFFLFFFFVQAISLSLISELSVISKTGQLECYLFIVLTMRKKVAFLC